MDLGNIGEILNNALELRGCDYSYLRSKTNPMKVSPLCDEKKLRIVDLFAGCGGISLGVLEAIQANGYTGEIAAAVEWEKAALDCYIKNFDPTLSYCRDITEILDGEIDSPLTQQEQDFRNVCGKVDILVGGPPCQGHSDLNNFSRRDDPKNSLYLRMARAAEVLNPRWIFIENVVGVVNDKQQVVQKTIDSLSRQGYAIETGVLDCTKIGLAQTRKRFILIASKIDSLPKIDDIQRKYTTVKRDLAWAMQDLEGKAMADNLLNQPSKPSKDNLARMKYMFDNGLYDLPNELRPACHRNKKHSYNSIYGRLKWDEPSQTLTSGFYSTSMGRYVHPSEQRTLTAHEAARIQGFPDFFNFLPAKSRTALAQIIGNAVPPKLSFVCFKEMIGVSNDK